MSDKNVIIDLQLACGAGNLPSEQQFLQWVELAVQNSDNTEVVIRIVDELESEQLNTEYRQKKSATNILSFPFELPEGLPQGALEHVPLGDLIVCASIVAKEAKEQHKPLLSHWAHMIIHGCLHLQGYDHVDAKDATLMESIEVKLLQKIHINNPYQEETEK